MRRKLIPIAFLLLAGAFLGATAFGEDLEVLAEKAPSFFVSNDATHPVPVRELGDPGRAAFTFFKNDGFQSSEASNFSEFTVPEGKRLVIQSISLQATLPAGQVLVLGSVNTRVNGELHVFHMGPTFHGPFGSGGVYIVSQQVGLYADGGTEVALAMTRNASTGSANANFSLAGYLIDCEVGACK